MRQFVLLCLLVPCLGSTDPADSVEYCLNNLLPESEWEPKLRFTKELKTKEFSRVSRHVSIHCCVPNGRRTILWYKGETPMPWSGDLSQLISFPTAANQTLYTTGVSETDAGNYTCEVHSDTAVIRHTIELIIIGEEEERCKVEITYKPSEVSYGHLTKSLRLYCHAFVGSSRLPDEGRASWERVDGKPMDPLRFNVTETRDEDSLEIGTYLVINQLETGDFGEYQCVFTSSGNQRVAFKTLVKEWTSPSTEQMTDEFKVAGRYLTLSLFSVTLFIIFYFVRLYFKNFFHIPMLQKSSGNLETKKLNLVLIYHELDEQFSSNILHPILKAKYNLITRLLSGKELPSETVQGLGDMPRCLVLSKNVTPEWTRLYVINILQSVINTENHVIVLLDPLPIDSSDQAFHFDTLMKPYKVIPYSSEDADFTEVLNRILPQEDSAPMQLVVNVEKISQISPGVDV